MSFEEDFPGLKDKKQAVCNYDGCLDYISGCENWEYPENPTVFENDEELFIILKDIQKCCLDKAKTKKVIIDFFKNQDFVGDKYVLKKLFERLGL